MKYIFLTILLSLIYTSVYSQTNVSVDVSANIITQLETTVVDNLNFGTVSQGTTEIIDAESDSRSAKISIIGSEMENVSVSVPTTVTLSDGETTPNTMDVDISTPRSNTTDDQSGSVSEAYQFTLTNSGEYFIWIGGVLEVLTNQTPNDYSGTLVVEVSYDI